MNQERALEQEVMNSTNHVNMDNINFFDELRETSFDQEGVDPSLRR